VCALGRIQFFDFSPKHSPVGKFDFNFDNKSFISTQSSSYPEETFRRVGFFFFFDGYCLCVLFKNIFNFRVPVIMKNFQKGGFFFSQLFDTVCVCIFRCFLILKNIKLIFSSVF